MGMISYCNVIEVEQYVPLSLREIRLAKVSIIVAIE